MFAHTSHPPHVQHACLPEQAPSPRQVGQAAGGTDFAKGPCCAGMLTSFFWFGRRVFHFMATGAVYRKLSQHMCLHGPTARPHAVLVTSSRCAVLSRSVRGLAGVARAKLILDPSPPGSICRELFA